MAGCSLTLVFLDDELEALWRAPADTPAYRKGIATTGTQRPPAPRRTVAAATGRGHVDAEVAPGVAPLRADRDRASWPAVAAAIDDAAERTRPRSTRSPATATTVGAWSRAHRPPCAAATAADDGRRRRRHGADRRPARPGPVKAGGTSGVLWGAALAALGERLGDDRDEITGADVAAAVRDGLDAITALGKCQARRQDHGRCAGAVRRPTRRARSRPAPRSRSPGQHAAADAEAAAQATAELKPKVGRARPLAERSLGTPDAGAVSFALCVRTAGARVADRQPADTARRTR